jgi:hypothetical protein
MNNLFTTNEAKLKRQATEAGNAFREALAEQPAQQQEPVALGYMNAGHAHEMQQGRLPYGYVYPKGGAGADVAVYTSPPASKPLTGLLSIARKHPDGRVVTVSFKTTKEAVAFEQYAIDAVHNIKEQP